MYQDHTLKSGRVVGMRPLTWDEYWDIQKTHLMGLKDLQEKGEAVTDAEFRLELMLAHKDFREKPLALCVKDWDAIKSELLMPTWWKWKTSSGKSARSPFCRETPSLPPLPFRRQGRTLPQLPRALRAQAARPSLR